MWKLLYTAEVLQAVHYFSNFKKDDWKLKVSLVHSNLALLLSELGGRPLSLSLLASTQSLPWEIMLVYIL